MAAYNTVHEGQTFDRPRDRNFELRDEQRAAIEAAMPTSQRRAIARNAVPRFLWNAKMRFGKTFAAYHLAKQRSATRVLVVTYKPAVEASWREDLETHIDFDGWVFFSRSSTFDPEVDWRRCAVGVLRVAAGSPQGPARTAPSRNTTSGYTTLPGTL